ncbi:MAG: sugar phosphate isomerase/epimerase [Treponema sp.]|jgi:sugar phosphate isomerase/epimerase|nr:sugar phosphate isomerase/epimerase [Treponema sp.]
MIRIGLRAHDYGPLPPEQLADTLTAFKPASIQLALSKAFPIAPGPGGLSPGYAKKIRQVFEHRHISIAVLGCYINPVHPDPEERNLMLRRFEEHLRFARDFDCSIVGTETGSLNPDCSWHPDTQKPETFDVFCSSLERLLNTAEKCGALVGIEPVADQHTIDSIERMSLILERFPSPSLKVIYDPVNLIPQKGLDQSQNAFFTQAFDVFGDHIAAIHAKDFRIDQGKKRGDLPSGTGDLNYTGLLSIVMHRKPGIDILLENCTPSQARQTIEFLTETAHHISL